MILSVISDTHLTSKFNERKFNKLKSIIESSDLIVLNGDFWDGYATDFEDFYNSKWSALFPLLKSKNTIYIFGNHDKEYFSDDRRKSFCDIATSKYTLEFGGKKLTFEHGDQHVWKIDRKLKISRPIRILNSITEFFQSSLINIMGLKGFSILFGGMNEIIKKSILKELAKDQKAYFFFGHVHVAELDLANRFINTGIFNYGYAQYVSIDDSGNIKAINDTY